MSALRKLLRLFGRLLAAMGFVTVLVICTPIVGWWARAYAGPIRQPKGDVLILLSAAADDEYGASPTHPTGAPVRPFTPGRTAASKLS